VWLKAGRDLNISAATDTSSTYQFHDEKTSGLFSGGGIGFTIGSKQMTDELKQTGSQQSQARSMVGSVNGNLRLEAGGKGSVLGSDVTAGKDILESGTNIITDPGVDTQHSEEKQTFSSSGFTFRLTNPVLSALQTVDQMAQDSKKVSDPRLQALAALNAGLAAKNGLDDYNKNPQQAGGFKFSIAWGNSHSENTSKSDSSTLSKSLYQAGGRVIQQASGAGADSTIVSTATDYKAKDVSLNAEGAVILRNGDTTAEQHTTSKSSSVSLGVSFGVGASGGGLTLDVSASKSKGNTDGKDVTAVNTRIEAGNTVSITSGGDTTLQGATIRSNKVVADVGGNLNVVSVQDTSTYTGHQESAGFSASIPIMGAGGGASVSLSKTDVHSNYSSVGEQTGIRAGDGGFQLQVKGNTHLVGGLIASSDQAVKDGKNSLTTASLSSSDIHNQADYSANSTGVSAGVGSMLSSTGAGFGHAEGHAGSATQSGISGGSLTVNGQQASTDSNGKAINTAVRSTDKETGIGQIFDATKVTADVNAQMEITKTFSQLAPKAVADYAGGKAADLKKQADKENDPAKKQELLDEAAKWDEGGRYRVVLHTVVGGLGGGVSGALGAGAVASAAPTLNDMQTTIQNELVKAGLPGGAAQIAGQLVGQVAATGIGAAAGGTTHLVTHKSIVMVIVLINHDVADTHKL